MHDGRHQRRNGQTVCRNSDQKRTAPEKLEPGGPLRRDLRRFLLYTILLAFTYTGIRPEELCGLPWDCVDVEKRTIRIKRTIRTNKVGSSMDKRGHDEHFIREPKSKYGKRVIRVAQRAIDALVRWQQELATSSEFASMRDSQFVFPKHRRDKQGHDFLNTSALEDRFSRFLKPAGLDDRGWHLYIYRHTMTTQLLRMGTPLDKVQRIMGDGTLRVILKIYNHIKDEDTFEYSDALFESQYMPNLESSGVEDGDSNVSTGLPTNDENGNEKIS